MKKDIVTVTFISAIALGLAFINPWGIRNAVSAIILVVASFFFGALTAFDFIDSENLSEPDNKEL